MEMIPYVVSYVAIGIFVVAVVARFFMWAKMPMHVRWELYPVAHEASRVHYGGSYLEEVDWWKKPREVSMVSELKEMIPEILFLVALKEHNPKMWARSFPFHFGLYLIIGATVLLFGNAILYVISESLATGGLGALIRYLTMACGVGGLLLTLFGSLGLLQMRLTDPKLKDYTAPADIFNLLFFVVAFGVALANFALFDRDFSKTQFFVHGVLTFQWNGMPGAGLQAILPVVTFVLMGALVAYIPLTHMSHFVGKYFSYHAIRWNDTPNLKGGPEEEAIGQLLQRPVSWAAPHINGDGKKSWAEAATEEMKK